MGSLAAPLISGGISALGSIFGRSGPSDQQKSAMTAQTNLANQQTSLSKQLSDYARGTYTMAQPALNQALNYYKGLAGGNTAAINSILAPQINQLGQSYAGARSQIANNPLITGGVRQTQLADLAKQQAGQLGLMPFEARMGANQSLAGLGQTLQGQTAGLAGGANQAAATGANALSQYLDQALKQQQIEQSQGEQVGKALTSAFVPWLLQKYGIKYAGATPAAAPADAAGFSPYLGGFTASGPSSVYNMYKGSIYNGQG